jgi:hypothetical protein
MSASPESDIKDVGKGDFLIAVGRPEGPIGTVDRHSLRDRAKDVVTRTEQEVQKDWTRVVGQAAKLVSSARAAVDDYELDEVTFELGFTVTGEIAFVASAEIATTIMVTFKKK